MALVLVLAPDTFLRWRERRIRTDRGRGYKIRETVAEMTDKKLLTQPSDSTVPLLQWRRRRVRLMGLLVCLSTLVLGLGWLLLLDRLK